MTPVSEPALRRTAVAPRRARSASGIPRAALLLTTVLALVGASCSAGDGSAVADASTRRADAVGRFVDQFVVPGVERAGRDADAMQRAIEDLCSAPDAASLRATRAGTTRAWRSWERLAVVDFGPVSERRSMSFVNSPVDVSGVDEQLASGPPADVDAARNRLASGRRGFGAVEHLLLGELASPLGPEAFDSPRCTYLRSLAALILEEAAGVEHGWNAGPSDGLPYRSTAKGLGDKAVASEEMVNLVVNAELDRLGAASKALTAAAEADGDPNQPPPGRIFAIAAMLDGVAATSERLAPILKPSLASRLADELAAARAAVREYADDPTVGRPSRADLEAAASAVETARATISTEVVSALDVTLGSSDNDGDS